EDALAADVEIPDIRRYKPVQGPAPSEQMIEQATAFLAAARRPVMLIGRVSRDQRDWDNRIRLAELLDLRVITDLRMGASFPTEHYLHGGPADLFLSPGDRKLLADADVILSLDWYDLGDAIAQTHSTAKVIHVSIDSQAHNAFSGDHQRIAPVDLAIPVEPDSVLQPLIEGLKDLKRIRSPGRAGARPRNQTLQASTPTLADIGYA